MELKASAEQLVDALRNIADDIENGMDSGETELGEWALQESEADDDEEDPYVEDPVEELEFDDRFSDLEGIEDYSEEDEEFYDLPQDEVDDYEDDLVKEHRRSRRNKHSADYDEEEDRWED
jgi:hypothetical protein